MLEKHSWKVNGRDALADRLGVKYQVNPGEEPVYIVGGTVCNGEILRLAEAATAPVITDELFVEVSWMDGAEPWLSGVIGRFDLGRLAELAGAVREDSYPLEREDLFGRYLFRVSWFPGQFDEVGRCELAPCYEVAERVRYEPWPDSE